MSLAEEPKLALGLLDELENAGLELEGAEALEVLAGSGPMEGGM